MATFATGRRVRFRVGVRAAAMAGALATAAPAARGETLDLYMALKDGNCVAIGEAVNRGMERNEAEAYFFAGYLYDATGCVAEDPAKAARFYRRAAELGNGDGRNALGRLYGLGRGVAQDYATAYRWYTAGKNGEPATGAADAGLARIGGYAITVAQVARDKARYPLIAERSSIESTLDAIFEPASGRVTIGSAKASVEVGSNIGKTGPFRDAVESAYADAIAAVRPPADVAQVPLRFSTPWRFAMRRSQMDDSQQGEGVITLGDTVPLPSPH